MNDITETKGKAEAGLTPAQAMLGISYLYGIGTDINYDEAARWLSIASEKGATRAIVNLADMYMLGLGIPKDITEAVRLYEACAEFEMRAQFALGKVYAKGAGVEIDLDKAIKYFRAVLTKNEAVQDMKTAVRLGCVTFDELAEAAKFVNNFASTRNDE